MSSEKSSLPGFDLTELLKWKKKKEKKDGPMMQDETSMEPENQQHRKQLAQILRYIANMHHSLGNDNGLQSRSPSFLRKTSSSKRQNEYWKSFFYSEFLMARGEEQQSFGVVFSTWSFRQLLAMEADSATPLFEAPPFSFYAAASGRSRVSPITRKRGWSAAFRNPLNSSRGDNNSSLASVNEGKACWLRLTRLTPSDIPERPSISNPAIRRFLQQWREGNAEEFSDCGPSPCDHITLETIGRAPKIAPTELAHAREISQFLRSYKTYLLKKAYQAALEPLYNKLFEWVQTENIHNEELVWGLGHARMCVPNEDGKTTVINGPLIEILLEVELSRDGALIVRPREHTGCSLNARVVTALASCCSDETSSSSTSTQQQRLTKLHRTVAELEPLQFAPGQPSTYVPLLKRIAVELSSGGTYQPSSSPKHTQHALPHYQMLVTEAWVVYARSKPTTVWARDALAFADQLLQNEDVKVPRAALALTHGPGAFDVAPGAECDETVVSSASILDMFWKKKEEPVVEQTVKEPIVFPLPTSDAQDRIADLLLSDEHPAVVCEGPPGTGKTHTIANMISAFLCQGKRVLITSKGPSALSVLRNRLPPCIQDLVVDVSASELTGMRQLQQTVERLANRVSCASAEMETEKSEILLRNIKALEQEQQEIDSKLAEHNNRKRAMIQTSDSQRLAEIAFDLIETVPWLAKTTVSWGIDDIKKIRNKLAGLLDEQKLCQFERVSTAGCLPTDAVVSFVAAKAGQRLSMIKQVSRGLIAAVPLVGSFVGGSDALEQEVSVIYIDKKVPDGKNDWKLVLDILQHQKNLQKLTEELEPVIQKGNWPVDYIFATIGDPLHQHRILKSTFIEKLEKLVEMKQLADKLGMEQELHSSAESLDLDARRSLIGIRMQNLAADLVDARVVMNLSQTFSAEAQSALIRFAQVSAKAKFSRASQPSKMTSRQRRHRQEYLEAFDRCVRYIPCWILTNSQISDYLPAEMLFDLVVIDEASQSDITALPGLLRGQKWLIVGDGKQVSPTESFISEESIDSLRAALPKSPMEDSLLPGQSFFDLSAQAYPRSRVVLSEHFRCAPEIIMYSNKQCYNNQLIPLRLPTALERITPSLADVRVDGRKVGKVNEKECDEIVKLVRNFVTAAAVNVTVKPRSIGVISLVGSDQAALIRGRLLDSIGPVKMKEHDLLIGDPPAFQGAERDVVFLSMVCSPGQIVSQTKLMHAQRFNVALSRARDQLVLVRSIDSSHVPNCDDLKLPVIEFFEDANSIEANEAESSEQHIAERHEVNTHGFQARSEHLLEKLLKARGYSIRSMGVVWKDALCIEHPGSNERAAIKVENSGESQQEWQRAVAQQRSIERVGWKCMRLDGFSLLMNHIKSLETVVAFLAEAGVKEPEIVDESNDHEVESEDGDEENEDRSRDEDGESHNMPAESVVVISSDDENAKKKSKPNCPVPDQIPSDLWGSRSDDIDASQFGEVVKLDFLAGGQETIDNNLGDEESLQDSEAAENSGSSNPVSRPKRQMNRGESRGSQDEGNRTEKRKGTKHRRLDHYSRDTRAGDQHLDDTDSDRSDGDVDQGGSSEE